MAQRSGVRERSARGGVKVAGFVHVVFSVIDSERRSGFRVNAASATPGAKDPGLNQ